MKRWVAAPYQPSGVDDRLVTMVDGEEESGGVNVRVDRLTRQHDDTVIK